MPAARALPFILTAVFVLSLPASVMIDATVRFQDLDRILHGRKPEEKFSMVGPLCATPLYVLGWVVGETERAVWCFNRLLALGGCAAFWWLLRPVLGPTERARFVVALLLTSMLPHHLMHFGGEVFSTFTVGFGLAAVVVRRAWWGVPLAVAGAVNTPGSIGGFAVAVVVLFTHTRRLRHLLAVPVACGLVLLENYVRRGDPFFTGYDGERGVPNALPFSGGPEFSYPLFFGVLSLLFSFGKGLVFFVPTVFLPPADPSGPGEADADLRWVYGVWVGAVVGLVLVYARWWAWYGGWFWGPRFLLFACLPAALVIARRTAAADRLSTPANLLTLAALALACWAGVNGVVFLQDGLERYTADDNALEFAVWYVPECSALWWPFAHPRPLAWFDWLRLAAGVAGFAYLAAPVLAVLGRRLPGHLTAAWAAVRGGPRLRF